ncbi:hypothetical protein [Streptomyces paludis]|uniref:Sulfotransferase family protein n=1 Tax=Streptomyces paludis TaxID=2282738 RepID=A0A345HIA1_9ACTN|nr:hypothetical protein [Streptomyces paludis]AXG76425.1 hypothetical protein DVK44_00610 [Streptomyces paludis]
MTPPAPHVIVVSPRGSGTPLLADALTRLGHTPYGTMSGHALEGADQPGPGEVHALLTAAYGEQRAARLLHRQGPEYAELTAAFHTAVSALWRTWWTRLGQPVTGASPVTPDVENRLTRLPDAELRRLLPGRGCWYLNSLDLQRADAGFLRTWHTEARPPIVYHHRDLRDRVISLVLLLSGPASQAGTLPDQLIYRDILGALPTVEDRVTLALTDPDFPGMAETRRCQWLLRHPAVTVITHEDLAGPAHGGTAEARERALTRLAQATGHPPTTATEAATTVGAAAQAGSDDLAVGLWHEYFTPAHERLLNQHHGDLPAPGARSPHRAAAT